MGLHSISNYQNYWKRDFINLNILSKRITKNHFKFICFALNLPISNDNFQDNNFDELNENNEYIENVDEINNREENDNKEIN